MKTIVIKNLKQKYTYGAVGIQDFSLECDKNEIVSILAPSEGGKTSLLQAISGLYPIAEGQIFIDGEEITHSKPKDRNILLVHEDGGFFKRKSVFYNLGFPLKIRKIPDDYIEYEVKKVAKIMGIENILGDKIFTLTGNEKVKVMIARTQLRKASVYMFDNPFKMAQPLDRHNLFIEMLPYMKELDGAILFATDLADEAKTISKRTYVLNYGFTVDSGSFENIVSKPQCLKSYSLLNGYAVNTLVTQIKQENNEIFIEVLDRKIILLKDKLINPIYIGKEIIVCFTTLASEGGIESNLDFVEYYNDSIIMHSKINENKIKTIINEVNNIPNFIDINPSSIKLFDISSERLVYFD